MHRSLLIAGTSFVAFANAAHAQSCAPVGYYYEELDQEVALQCDATGQGYEIMELELPTGVTGRAVAGIWLHIKNETTGETWFWNTRVDVGNPIANYSIGDDICAQDDVWKMSMGYGQLTSTANTVTVYGLQGRSPCDSGEKLVLQPDSQLAVWVEDPAPQCVESTIKYSSFYDTNGANAAQSYLYWPDTLMTVLSDNMTLASGDTGLIVLSNVEGTPWTNPNTTCGSETETLTQQILINGTVDNTETLPIPASQGFGHLAFGQYAYELLSPGTYPVEVKIRRDYGGAQEPPSYVPNQNPLLNVVTSGGCCGDAAMAVIRY